MNPNQSERDVRDRLAMRVGGSVEVGTPAGRIDILTDNEVIEVKHISMWKSAMGQVLAYNDFFPSHSPRVHLFGHGQFRTYSIALDAMKKRNIRLTVEEDFFYYIDPNNRPTDLKRKDSIAMSIDMRFLLDVAMQADGTEHLGIDDGAYATTMGMLERFYKWAALTKANSDTMNSKRLGTTLTKVLGPRRKMPKGRVSVAQAEGIHEDRPSVYQISFDLILQYNGHASSVE